MAGPAIKERCSGRPRSWVETINYPLPVQYERCHTPSPPNEAQIAERLQVFDVPAMSFAVVEHRTLELACTYGQVHVSTFPLDVTEMVQYATKQWV